MASSYLIDISRWQGDVDHVAVARAGISGCVVKASEGLRSDTAAATVAHFRKQAPLARRAYQIIGAYHYLLPGNAAAQVTWFLEQVTAGYGGLGDVVVQLDAEEPGISVQDVRAWKVAWDAATGGYPCLLYAPRWFWEPVAGNAQLAGLGFAGWWPSNYVDGSGDFRTLAGRIGARWAAWNGLTPVALQFSQKGVVPGVDGPVDLDEIRLPLAQFEALTTENLQRVPQAEWDDARTRLDQISDTVAGGRGSAYRESRMREDHGFQLDEIERRLTAHLGERATAIETRLAALAEIIDA